MIDYLIYSRSCTFWIVTIVLVIFILWLFVGGGKYEFVGLKPLESTQKAIPYVHHLSHNERSSYARTAEDLWLGSTDVTDILSTAEDPCVVDTTPQLPEFIPPAPPPEPKSKKFESKGERKCREVMERRYGRSFPKVRPPFLRNPETGYLLELDCFCEELQLAVEYNGIQHYVWPNFTHQSYENFIKQRRRDQLKVDLCDLNGVYLITVPYNVPHNQIEDYIIYYLPENVQQRLLEERKADSLDD